MPAGLLRPRLTRAAIVTFLASAMLAPGATAHAASSATDTAAATATATASAANAAHAARLAHAAHATAVAPATASAAGVRTTTAVADRILALAASQYGKPYRYGGTGPNSFDCSGLTAYVFARVGVSLPHNAAGQYDAVNHVAKADRRPGDLIFMYGGGGIYHVAIYAGDNMMWAATHTGDIVRKERIYSSQFLVGRA